MRLPVPRALRDHPQRVRHRPRRQRRGAAERRSAEPNPALEPARRRPRDPRQAEQDARRPGAQLGDTVLAPLAREQAQRSRASSTTPATTAQATAERSDDLEQNFARFPAFLRELGPTMRQLGEFSDAVHAGDRATCARGADRSTRSSTGTLGPFSRRGDRRRSRSLGDARRRRSGPALRQSLPLVRGPRDARAQSSRPADAEPRATLLIAAPEQGGIEQPARRASSASPASTNGYDEFGHYLRARLVLGTCHDVRDGRTSSAARANFSKDNGAVTSRRPRRGVDREAPAATARTARRAAAPSAARVAAIKLPKALLPGDRAGGAVAAAALDGPARADVQPLLDYLLGG